MSLIPKNIFQTHKSSSYLKQKPKLLNAMKSWAKFKGEFRYCFFDNAKCDEFMNQYFDEKVNMAYSILPMGVMKADLWRYCVIYIYGGIYADVDTICKVNPNIFINNALLNVSPEIGTNFFCQWSFSAPANSPILKTIIDLSVDRILTTPIKGEHIIHFLTGPACFTDGIIRFLKENNLPTFVDVNNYINYPASILRVCEPNIFHSNCIEHLFAGSDKDGWKKERYKILT